MEMGQGCGDTEAHRGDIEGEWGQRDTKTQSEHGGGGQEDTWWHRGDASVARQHKDTVSGTGVALDTQVPCIRAALSLG